MAFQIHYRPLCSVSIRHGFHLNKGSQEFDDLSAGDQRRKLAGFDIHDDLRLEVPDDTLRVLDGLGMLVRPTPTGFIVAVEVDEPTPGVFVPRRIPLRGYRLRFVLRARAPHFWDYTNLDLGPREGGIYYLSNRAGESGGSPPSLSLPPVAYATSTVYRAGDVVRASAATTRSFLAVRSGTHAVPGPGDANWLQLGQRNYVNANDQALLRAPRFRFRFRSDDAVNMALVDLVAADGTTHELGDYRAPAGETLGEIMIDARAVSAGKYLLQINGVDTAHNGFNHSEDIYIDPAFPALGVFSIIELFHQPGDALGDFRFYDEAADFELRSPEFRVQLLNRHTYWRYHFPDPPDPTADLGDLERVGDQFVTKRAMPLTRGVERVEFGAASRLLPNPSNGPVIPEADRVYSDIHVPHN